MTESRTRAPNVDIIVQHESLSIDPDLCRRALHAVFAGEDTTVAIVTLIQADHAIVRHLNRTYLEHDYDTDVLAFPYSEEHESLEGEIYVDLDTAAEQHGEFGASFEQEALRYAIHGALHLAGYRDDEPTGKNEMHELEDRYLRAAGVL